MAFNPFNIFRRNQRALFAVVTVFIMFTFVLSSGLGGGADFFDWLPNWLGKNKKGTDLCSIDGSKVYEGDLAKLRFKRVMANRFMELAALVAEDNFQRTLAEMEKSLSPESIKILPILAQNPQFVNFLGRELKQEEKDFLKAIQAYQAVSQMRMYASMQRQYFLNAPNRDTRDLIDFIIWEKKADEMGIRFTEDDIKALIQKEFYGQFKSDVEVRRALEKDMPGFSLDACLKAIGDEFRVRAVQTALLGPQILFPRDDTTRTAPPLFIPPYELYDFYREKVSPTTYWAVAVPAANFTDAVTGQPSEEELKALFNKYKDQEYDPAREDPGFRQSRRIKIEWVTANGTEPYYAKRAEEWVAKTEQMRKSELGALAVPLPGVGPGFLGLAIAPNVATEPLLYHQYFMDIAFNHPFIVRNQYSSATVMPWDLLNTSILRPANLAALTGGMAGGLGGFGGPTQAASLLFGGAVQYEQADRIRAGMPFVGGSIPGFGLENTLLTGIASLPLGYPKVLPIEVYAPNLMKQAVERKAKELAKADLQQLRVDLDKIAADKEIKKPEEKIAKSKELIASFLKERGLTASASTDLRDEWNIEDDPALAPLKAAMKGNAVTDPHRGLSQPIPFGKKFFWKEDPRTGARAPATGLYQPEFYTKGAEQAMPGQPQPVTNDPVYLFWRTEDQPSKGLTFDQAKSSGVLLEGWKRIKSRELARARADAIANRLRGRTVTSPAQVLQNIADEGKILTDEFRSNPKAAERIKIFDLDNVAPLAPKVEMDPRTGGGKTVAPYSLEPSTNIAFPTPEMEKALLEERTKPVGSVMVLVDQPKDTYYVVGLVNRRVLSPRDFNTEVFSQMAQQGGVSQGVHRAFDREAMKKARDSVLDLLKKEFDYQESEEQTKRINANAKDDGDE